LDRQLLGYLQEAGELNINMDIYIPEPVGAILRKNNIDQLRFQRAVGDMVRNAFRAIERDCRTKGQVLLVIGSRCVDIIEISVMDNGAEFPLQVLEAFGKRGISTGGTGNGLADLMEFAKEVDASVMVEEFAGEAGSFTKRFSLIFDRKQKFYLRTSRKVSVGSAQRIEEKN
jgi:sensor histidine kinase regulating citrate/malate metabolism